MRLRAHTVALGLLLLAPAARAQPRSAGAACRESCERYVRDARLRANACKVCLLGAADRGGWVEALLAQQPDAKVLAPLLEDADWALRWASVRAQAKARGATEATWLAGWVAQAQGEALLKACETALHAAGARKETAGALLARGGAQGPPAAARCWAQKDALRARVQKGLFAQEGWAQREALLHLAAFLEVPPARVALDAVKASDPLGDELLAQLLLWLASEGGPPAGAGLLAVARPDEGPAVDRLLARWAPRVDRERARLASEHEADRRDAVAALAALGPLGARELEGALQDPSPRVAVAAARGLARGEGRTLAALVDQRLSPEGGASEQAQVTWVELLGRAQEPGCHARLGQVLSDARHADAVRAAAARALAHCGDKGALAALRPALAAPQPVVRAGAVEALGLLPRAGEAPSLVATALKDPEPQVQAAAARAAGELRLGPRALDLAGLLESGAPPVRLAAAQALAKLAAPAASSALARALAQDTDAAVREACALALAEVPPTTAALEALTRAAGADPERKVKLAAAAALRRLGFQPAQGKPGK